MDELDEPNCPVKEDNLAVHAMNSCLNASLVVVKRELSAIISVLSLYFERLTEERTRVSIDEFEFFFSLLKFLVRINLSSRVCDSFLFKIV